MRALGTLLAFVASVAVAAPAAAEVRYIAFGDSNTRGNDCIDDPGASDPPDFVFDDGPGCLPTTPCNLHGDAADDCGYAYRLESELAAGVPDAVVVNAGSGGETVVQGITRLDSRISSGDDVLVLIHGTNDVTDWLQGDPGAIPPEDVANIIGLMIDKATEIGMDTLVGSPIHRICPQFPDPCPGVGDPPRPEAWPEDPTTEVLDREINDDIGPGRHRKSVSPWFRIGKDQGEVDQWYFQEDLRFGHIRNTGYARLADNPLERNITGANADDALGAPNPLSPMGETDESGVFSWEDYADPDTGARLWQLEIDGPLGGTFHDDFYEQHEVCSNGTCTVDVGTLDSGDYTWRVRGKNLRGPSPYSAESPFTVVGEGPGATELLYPLEQLFENDPSFDWLEVDDATQYTLEIDGVGEIVSAAACGGGSCTVIRGEALALGGHLWRVRAENGNGVGPWTPLASFEVIECAIGQLTLDADDTGSGSLFEACGIIFAGNGFRVQAGEQVRFHAGNRIELQNGFEIESNAGFEAVVDH